MEHYLPPLYYHSIKSDSTTKLTDELLKDNFDDSRQKIDTEIQKLENTIRALKSRRNMLSPMIRLPPEVLLEIFTIRQCQYDLNYMSWITVSHVCSHWRAVALGCPGLWSSISTTNSKWAIEMLRRSMMASLDVRAEISSLRPREPIKVALAQISRIRTLYIRITGSLSKMGLTRDLSGAAPLLESLFLLQMRNDQGNTLPRDFLSGGTPSLRRLNLLRCDLNWDSALLQNLTHVKIVNVRLSHRPTTTQLINALRSMPLLESLYLRDALPVFPHDATSVDPPIIVVDLPHLSNVHVDSSILECANLFNHISLSPIATLKLICGRTKSSSGSLSSLLPSLSRFMSSRNAHMSSLVVGSHSHYDFHLEGWFDHEMIMPQDMDACNHLQSGTLSILDLSFSWSEQEPTSLLESNVNAVCECLRLTELRSLCLGIPQFPADLWITHFGALDSLRSVEAWFDAAKTLIDVLRMNRIEMVEHRKMSPPNVYFCGVRNLCLKDTDLTSEDLRDVLMIRREEGAEVSFLSLSKCPNLHQRDIDLLAEIVVDVGWDGYKVDEEEEEEMDSNSPSNGSS